MIQILFYTHIIESLHSIGSPLTNQLTVGRGAPSERHTRRPLSSGAKTKSAGFSNQNGAAVSCKYIRCFNIIAQRDSEKTLSPRMRLTFDHNSDCVLNVALFVGSSADVFAGIVKGCFWNLNHLVEILYFHGWLHHEIFAIFDPFDVRSRP